MRWYWQKKRLLRPKSIRGARVLRLKSRCKAGCVSGFSLSFIGRSYRGGFLYMDSFGHRLYAVRRSPFFPVYERRGAALWRRRRQSPLCERCGGEAAAAAPHGSMKPSHSSGPRIRHGSGSPRTRKRLFMTDPAFMRICVEQTAICLISFSGKWGALYVSRETFFSMGLTGKAVPAQTEADAGRYPRQDGILHMHEGQGRTACLAARLRGKCPQSSGGFAAGTCAPAYRIP